MRYAALAVAVVAAGCGTRHITTVAPSASWAPVPPPCRSGGPRCVPLVVAEMGRRYRPLAAACDHGAPFALMYLRVTQAVGRAETGFDDRRYLARLDALFAGLYFQAFDAWRADHRTEVPLAWQIAFEAADRGRASGLGDLLLGMNAHISRDLPFAVAALGLGPGPAAARRSFEQVNTVLERVARAMLEEQAHRFDPTVTTSALPVLSATPSTFGALLVSWRDAALRDAERLLHAHTTDARASVVQTIERSAAARAALIAAATSRVPYSQAGKARDSYCRAQP